MPRIAVRTTPYSNVARCTRHYKAKRDLILRALGKASFINGSQFVVTWISPKGEVDVYASELLQDFTGHACKDAILDRAALEAHAGRIRSENDRRWADVARLEVLRPSQKGKAEAAEVMASVAGRDMDGEDDGMLSGDEQDGDEGDADLDEGSDPDRTLVEDEASSPPRSHGSSSGSKALRKTASALGQDSMMMTTTTSAALAGGEDPTPEQAKAMSEMHAFHLTPSDMAGYYQTRFTWLQQDVCKLIVKAWIKVIEPKKQNKYPYNKGDSSKPDWWPEGVRHREPDHLHKQERLSILATIIRSDKVDVAKLELSTAECCALIPQSRHATLRELYAVAKEEQRLRQTHPGWDRLTVHLPETTSATDAADQVPIARAEHKRSHAQMAYAGVQDENSAALGANSASSSNGAYLAQSSKRARGPHGHHTGVRPTLGQVSTNVGYPAGYSSPFTTAPQTFATRGDMAPVQQYAQHHALQQQQQQPQALFASHPLYAHDQYSAAGQEYRSPNPDDSLGGGGGGGRFPHHLAPILGHSQSHSSQGAASPMISPQPYTSDSYYGTSAARGYMHQQQLEFMQQQQQHHGGQPPQTAQSSHQGFYDSQYVGGPAQDSWGQSFSATTAN